MERFDVLAPGREASRQAAALMERYWLSHTLHIPDALIASTAIERDLPFWSGNQKDYRFIPNLDLRPYPPE